MDHERLAAAPVGAVRVPHSVTRLTEGHPLIPVWENGLGGLTFFDADGRRYIKWVATGTPELDLAAEAERVTWAAAAGARVPNVLELGEDGEGSWLATEAIPGDSAVAPHWIGRPEIAARALGAGLRELHERLDPSRCPFDWSVEARLEQARERRARGEAAESWSAEHRRIPLDRAWELLQDPPSIDRLVVCHVDACAPNTLLDDSGGFLAHVDLDALGVADRWADLAISAWSTEWNYGPGFGEHVYEGYGIDPDPARIAYYRLLWDLS
ncbi:MAG: aminoglycoside 3'-phosphotransferase [Actinobacteria bacterium]|nr:aminoglycoside 3'-phosphotransferase [Actinomycetota bacterium]